jgi:hypothetical protein
MSSNSKSGFIPVGFSNFGKSVRDMFKKKFEYDNKFKIITNNKSGLNVEFGSVVDSESNNLRGYVKETLNYQGYTIEGEVNTDPTAETKASVKTSKLVKGLTIEAKANTKSDDKSIAGPVYSGEGTYAQEYINVSTEFKTNKKQHKVKSGVSVGFDGVSAGGNIVADVSNNATITDYNVGLEYSRPTYTASLWTEKQCDVANLGYWHRFSPDRAVAAQFKLQLGGKYEHSLIIGEECAFDSSTNFKCKAEIPSGQVSLAVEHRLSNPQLLFNLAAQFTPKTFDKGVKADKFGFGITLGDY